MAMDLRKLIEDSKILLDALADAVCIKDSDGEAGRVFFRRLIRGRSFLMKSATFLRGCR